jgi:enoyl-CoA hydratase
MEKVLYEVNNCFAWITLNRPEVHNAVDYDVMSLINQYLDMAETDEDVKVLFITGAGNKAFCSGGDLQKFHNLHTKEEAHGMLSEMGKVLYRIATFPKPTVALMNGIAVGGGCELVTSCDYRIAVEGKKFGFIQGTLGITTGWGGSAILLERLKREDAMLLLYSGDVLTVETGYEIGFINALIQRDLPIKDQAETWSERISSLSLPVIKAYKSYDIERLKLSQLKERMEKEVEQCAVLWESDEHHVAVRKFLSM